ncbi:MAG: hypothetical protein AB1733_12240 [Thermodesulfobacteriota bacterium]
MPWKSIIFGALVFSFLLNTMSWQLLIVHENVAITKQAQCSPNTLSEHENPFLHSCLRSAVATRWLARPGTPSRDYLPSSDDKHRILNNSPPLSLQAPRMPVGT